MSSSAGIDLSAITREILDSIDIASEYERMGVRFASQKVTSRGWRECYAAGRDESSPSAAVNLGHGKLQPPHDRAPLLRHGGRGRPGRPPPPPGGGETGPAL